MSIIPSRLLKVQIASITEEAWWTTDDGTGDPWIGTPYRWAYSIILTAVQFHGSHQTREPYQYDLLDVKIGDWLANLSTGRAVQIVNMSNATATSIDVVVEDVERYNQFNDRDGNGAGGLSTGEAIIFAVNDAGIPLLAGVESNLFPASFQTDLISRFAHRNTMTTALRFDQPGHGFAIGDIIILDPADSLFKKAQANSAAAKNVIGRVSEIHTPLPDSFTIKPFDTIHHDITPALPGGRGSLIYLHPTISGALTATKPDSWALPVYLQLDANGSRGLVLNRGIDIVGPSGRGTSVQVVADITARNELTVADGDQVFVIDAGQNEWALFLYRSGTWEQIATRDSSDVDARSITKTITFNDGVVSLHRVSSSSRVTDVTVEVTQAFNSNAILMVGDGDSASRLMDATDADLSVPGVYRTTPYHQYTGGTETDLLVTVDPAGSITGEARITISYS